MRNGCGGEGGYKFSLLKKRLKKLDLFDNNKLDKLYKSIEDRACNPHDDAFHKGGGIIDYLKANLDFVINLFQVIHWTSIKSRFIIGVVVFIGLNIFGIRYFKWTKIF